MENCKKCDTLSTYLTQDGLCWDCFEITGKIDERIEQISHGTITRYRIRCTLRSLITLFNVIISILYLRMETFHEFKIKLCYLAFWGAPSSIFIILFLLRIVLSYFNNKTPQEIRPEIFFDVKIYFLFSIYRTLTLFFDPAVISNMNARHTFILLLYFSLSAISWKIGRLGKRLERKDYKTYRHFKPVGNIEKECDTACAITGEPQSFTRPAPSYGSLEDYHCRTLSLHGYQDLKRLIQQQLSDAEHPDSLFQYLVAEEPVLYMNNEIKYQYLYLVNTLIAITPWFSPPTKESFFIPEATLQMEKTLDKYEQLMGYYTQKQVYTRRRFELECWMNTTFKPALQSLRENITELSGIYADFTKEYAIIEAGIQGEATVNQELEKHTTRLRNLTNIRLEVDGQSIENDNILITPQGIFVLEVKNYGREGGYGLQIERDGRWLKILKNGRQAPIANADSQNNRHIAYLKRFLDQQLSLENDKQIPVRGMVVIPNNTIQIRNDSLQTVVRSSEIINIISSSPVSLSIDEMQELAHIITRHNLPANHYPLTNFRKNLFNYAGNVLDHYEKFLMDHDQMMRYIDALHDAFEL